MNEALFPKYLLTELLSGMLQFTPGFEQTGL